MEDICNCAPPRINDDPSEPPTRRAQLRNALSPEEWRRANWMFASIAALHIIGFGVFIIFVIPGHYKGFGIGICILAYTWARATLSMRTTSPPSITPRANS